MRQLLKHLENECFPVPSPVGLQGVVYTGAGHLRKLETVLAAPQVGCAAQQDAAGFCVADLKYTAQLPPRFVCGRSLAALLFIHGLFSFAYNY